MRLNLAKILGRPIKLLGLDRLQICGLLSIKLHKSSLSLRLLRLLLHKLSLCLMRLLSVTTLCEKLPLQIFYLF